MFHVATLTVWKQEWLASLVEKSKAAGAKGARSKGPKGGKWTKEEVRVVAVKRLQCPCAFVDVT